MGDKVNRRDFIKKTAQITGGAILTGFVACDDRLDLWDRLSHAKIYVTNSGGNSVSVIDNSTFTVTATITGSFGTPTGVGVNPNTNRIYVADFGTSAVVVIDGNTNTFIQIGLTNSPNGVGVNTNRVFVANRNSGNISVIDGDTNTVVSAIGVGTTPVGVGVMLL